MARRKWVSYTEYCAKAYYRELESKVEYKRIRDAQARGIKNPYFNFINNLPEGLTGLANKV